MKTGKSVLPQRDLPESFNPYNWLSQLWRIPFIQETEPEKVDVALRERIKELNCLYGLARLAECYHDSMDEFLKYLVDFLPLSWQYPEITSVRVVFQGDIYKSKSFKSSKWRQYAQIMMYNEPVGDVTVYYLEERPAADEGPFLNEERVLLEEVARRIGAAAVRIAAEEELREINKQLSTERMALQEANAALRAVLAKIEEEKNQIYRDMKANIDKIVMPILHSLALELPKGQRKYVEILRTNLEELTQPFVKNVLDRYHVLSPTEITICNMIRNGMRTKDIAELRGISSATVNRHREHIRRKLKIAGSAVNLTSYLQSFFGE